MLIAKGLATIFAEIRLFAFSLIEPNANARLAIKLYREFTVWPVANEAGCYGRCVFCARLCALDAPCAEVLAPAGASGADSVLNGIAWDAKKKRLFVTGKRWPQLFEIRLK